MDDMSRTERLQRARRQEHIVYSGDGDALGWVDALYYDLESGEPKWIGVAADATSGRRLVPVRDLLLAQRAIRLPYDSELVEGSPSVEDEEIDEELERALTEHYGLHPPDERDTAVLDEPIEEEAGPALVRSEERLDVGKRQIERGRVRLRKWVETEPASVDVELLREVARVVRRQVGVPVEGVELGEQVLEIPVYAERPVVEKRVVAVERIAVEKGVARTVETISDEVRVERVEAEEEPP